ncbi:MAG: PilN domain-containing protein [Syntrophobacteraceae bacterium]
MILINLLPVKKRKSRGGGGVREFLLLYALSIALAASTIAYLWVSKTHEIQVSQTRLNKLKQDIKQYEKFEKILNDLKKEKDLIEKRRTVIAGLQKDRDKMVRVLALLGAETPENRLWLEKLVQSGQTLTLDGVALSNETIAEFMRDLEESPFVAKGSVSLTHSRQIIMNNLKLREFRLALNFLPYSAVQEKLKQQDQNGAAGAPKKEG